MCPYLPYRGACLSLWPWQVGELCISIEAVGDQLPAFCCSP